jgi:K+-transporting ATPase ATPase C chain
MPIHRGTLRQTWTAVRALIVFTVLLGLAYPLALVAVGQLALPAQANGSLVSVHGKPVGSSLLGQSFTTKKGAALAQWFQSRPSAAGDGYDAGASSGSNYGPENATLIASIRSRQAAIAKSDGVAIDQIPADAVTASGSGLDPDISPAYALLQVKRVAATRGLAENAVRKLVESKIQGRDFGYLGAPVVNVLELNIALVHMK